MKLRATEKGHYISVIKEGEVFDVAPGDEKKFEHPVVDEKGKAVKGKDGKPLMYRASWVEFLEDDPEPDPKAEPEPKPSPEEKGK